MITRIALAISHKMCIVSPDHSTRRVPLSGFLRPLGESFRFVPKKTYPAAVSFPHGLHEVPDSGAHLCDCHRPRGSPSARGPSRRRARTRARGGIRTDRG